MKTPLGFGEGYFCTACSI